MEDVTAHHARNLKRDRLLSEKERERLMDREDASKLAINDARVRKKLSNWLKTLDDVSLILTHLPEEQSRDVVTNENVFDILRLAARAMQIKRFYPIDGNVNDSYTWNTDYDTCKPLEFTKCNTDLYKAKFGSFITPCDSGMGKFDRQLISLLETGISIDISGLLKGLRLDTNDSEVLAILEAQLQELQAFGLIENTANGWRWICTKASEKEKA